MRVTIPETDGTPWHVEVVLEWEEVQAELSRVSFQARADGARDIEFALTENHEPWTNLGLHGNVRVTRDWRTYFVDFVPTRHAQEARLCFWLGQTDQAVELGECRTRPIEEGAAWRVTQHGDCSAQLLSLDEPQEADRVELLKCDGTSGHVGLVREGFEVLSDAAYRLVFSARAEARRVVGVSLTEGREPWRQLGLSHEVELTPEWNSYVVDFAATEDARRARLCFWLGRSSHAVELGDCSIQPARDVVAWQLRLHKDCSARLLSVHEPCEADRLEILECDGNFPHIGIVRPGFEVRADGCYRLTFRGRAEARRQIRMVLCENREPWSELGLSHVVELTPMWRTYVVDFAATETVRRASLCFWMGESHQAVELAEYAIRPIEEIVAWQLAVHEDCCARLLSASGTRKADRIEILGCDGNPWHVGVVRSGLRTSAGGQHRLVFSARADDTRRMSVALCERREPWSDLGASHAIELTREWRTYLVDFTATKDEECGRLCFWLGESGHAVELGECCVVSIEPGVARQMMQHEACAAQLVSVHTPREAQRVEILECDGEARHLGVARVGFRVSSGGDYRLMLSARSDGVRPMSVSLNEDRSPWPELGLSHTVELAPEWRTYVVDFAATKDEDSARLWFWLGHSSSAVELGECLIRAIDTRAAWHLVLDGECQAQRVCPAEQPEIMRVEMGRLGPAPWCARLVRTEVTLAAGQRCSLHVSARSDRTRRVAVGVWQSHEPWDSLGRFREIELDPDWRTFEEEFVSTGDDSSACVGFWLGGDNASVEFADVAFNVLD